MMEMVALWVDRWRPPDMLLLAALPLLDEMKCVNYSRCFG